MPTQDFNLNPIGGKNFQIYGGVTGLATHRIVKNQPHYILNFSFFIGSKHIRIKMNETDHTVRTKDDIINRINDTIAKENTLFSQ